MTANLLRETWMELDSFELRLLLDERIGHGHSQYDGDSDKLHLPLARSSCRISLTFKGNKIVAMEPGPAFDTVEWKRISAEIEKSILVGSPKVGREFSFSRIRVAGSWRGDRSGVQILPPPAMHHALRAEV